MEEMKSYKIKGKKGVNDLKSIYAFHGNSQGDETRTNEISDYIASKGWLSYIFTNIDVNDQQAIYEESKRRYKENEEYINKLKEEGKYGEEYETTINLIHNPIFDEPNINTGSALESYKLVFLDFDKIEELWKTR